MLQHRQHYRDDVRRTSRQYDQAKAMTDRMDVTLNMRVRPDILAQIDAAAKLLGETRSQFIRRAAIKKAIEIVNGPVEARLLRKKKQ